MKKNKNASFLLALRVTLADSKQVSLLRGSRSITVDGNCIGGFSLKLVQLALMSPDPVALPNFHHKDSRNSPSVVTFAHFQGAAREPKIAPPGGEPLSKTQSAVILLG
jgi:hypothetical protein